MFTRTLSLIESIDSGNVVGIGLGELVELARLNKVLLGFLRRTGFEGWLRVVEEKRYERYMSRLAGVVESLEGLDYALFKFRRPVDHVSVDIDLLIRVEHLPEAVRRLNKVGFKIKVLEPYTVTMVKGEAIIDLYTHPAFAWIVYLDGERLLEEAEEVSIQVGEDLAVEARALSLEAEVVATITHAVYKEHIYLLSDYYVVKQWLSKKTVRLAEELNATDALETSLEINRQIEEGLIETPFKLSPARTASILTRKFARDPWFRGTSINVLKLASRKRTAMQLVSRLKRKSY